MEAKLFITLINDDKMTTVILKKSFLIEPPLILECFLSKYIHPYPQMFIIIRDIFKACLKGSGGGGVAWLLLEVSAV